MSKKVQTPLSLGRNNLPPTGDVHGPPPEEPEAKAEKKEKTPAGMIAINRFNFQHIPVTVVGTSPLHVNCFPEKEKRRMRTARETDSTLQAPKPKSGSKAGVNRPARDFDQEYQDSLYPLDGGGYGFPAIAFKKALVGACRQTNMEMTLANRIIFVDGPHFSRGTQCVAIVGKPRMVEVVVRLASQDRPPDLRYLGEFFPWKALLMIEFNADILKAEGVMNLVQFAGHCEGVGEQRPSARKSTGDFGRFRLAREGEWLKEGGKS